MDNHCKDCSVNSKFRCKECIDELNNKKELILSNLLKNFPILNEKTISFKDGWIEIENK